MRISNRDLPQAETAVGTLIDYARKSKVRSLGVLLRLLACMNSRDFLDTEKLDNLTAISLGISDSMLRQVSGGLTPGCRSVNANALATVCHNIFSGNKMYFAGDDDRDLPGECVAIGSTYFRFCLCREYLREFDRYAKDSEGVNIFARNADASRLHDLRVRFVRQLSAGRYLDHFRNTAQLRSAFIEFIAKAPLPSDMLEPVARNRGTMGALLCWLGCNSEFTDALERQRNAFAHTGKRDPKSKVADVLKARRALVLILAGLMPKKEPDKMQQLIDRVSYFIQNPFTLLGSVLATLSKAGIAIIMLVCVGFLISMGFGKPEIDRVYTGDMTNGEKIEFYDAVARRDTTAVLDFAHRYRWLRENGIKPQN